MHTTIIIMMIAAMAAAVCAALTVWLLYARATEKKAASAPNGATATAVLHNDEMRIMRARFTTAATLREKAMIIAELVGGLINRTALGKELITDYIAAGSPRDLTNDQLVGMLIFPALPITIIVAMLSILLAPPLVIAAPILGLGLGYFALKNWIAAQQRERLRAIAQSLPYIIDLITMAMSAGAPFFLALEMVTKSYRDTPIGKEFTLVLRNVQSGIGLADALTLFKERLSAMPIAGGFADDVIGSQRYGNPLTSTLENSARRFQMLRIQTAREAAGKAKVKILIPGIVVLFGSLLLLFGPFVVKFVTQQKDRIGVRSER